MRHIDNSEVAYRKDKQLFTDGLKSTLINTVFMMLNFDYAASTYITIIFVIFIKTTPYLKMPTENHLSPTRDTADHEGAKSDPTDDAKAQNYTQVLHKQVVFKNITDE